MIAYCAHCGGENRSEAQFCRFCGQDLGTYPGERVASRTEESQPSPLDQSEVLSNKTVPYVQTGDSDEQSPPDLQPPEATQEPLAAGFEGSDGSPLSQVEPATVQEHIDILTSPHAIDGVIELVSPSATPAGDIQPPPDQDAASFPEERILPDRFRMLGSLPGEADHLIYQAVDLLRCWNCHTLQSEPGLRFCEDCGAESSQECLVNLRVIPPNEIQQLSESDCEWFEHAGRVFGVELPSSPAPDPKKSPLMRLVSGFHTDQGLVREINEDSLLVLQCYGLCETRNSPLLAFYAVADGIGGQDAGEVASRIAVHTLAAQLMQRIFVPELAGGSVPLEELIGQLRQAILAANQAILDQQKASGGSNMGCTLTAALLRDSVAIVANIGDSRTYRLHAGCLTQLTRDHSMIARIKEETPLPPDNVMALAHKGVIYRSLGDESDLVVDLDIHELSIGDRLLLCSDGLWEMLIDEFIEDVLLEQFDPMAASQRLVKLANLAGGDDNISVIVVDLMLAG